MGRIRMQLGLLLGLAPLVAAQREAPGIFKRLAMAGEEILERAVSDFDKCSCRCCQATERKDQEVERSSYGSLLTHKCVHPYPATEKCPAECTASHRLEAAQTAAKGVLDYGRFCFHACTPTVMVNGGTCSTPEEAAALRAAAAGNAARNAAEAWHPADMKISEEPQLAAAPAPAPAPVKPVEEEKEVKKITWDLRNIRAQRARAERYAADARAAYAAEQVKLHTHEIKSTVKMLDRVKKSVSEDTKSFEPEVLKAKANASAAGDAAVETYNVFKKAKAQSRKVRAETRDLARTIIAEAAAGAAQAEAESFVRRMHQAEVANFRAQVANQASLPYAGGVTTGVQREAEYRKLAEDSDVTAREAEIQMDDAEKEAKRLEQSDRVLAGMRNREATALRHQAEDAQAAASRYRSLAKKAHSAALGWQEASAKNSEHVADMYDLSVAVIPTPPPLVGIPRPPAFR